ncbi:putative ubiquitinyl hydrolase 1 [Rosa chinensis]|uniref:Putative ubiquitinyl hydrolase 1 n=1 Tax=Rosa chinensis TaxID=74649 RepID=A0A2P6SKL1_ROSCH|nr:putative ubiquitinyl hydrolase 1 [Rosa chinensis]
MYLNSFTESMYLNVADASKLSSGWSRYAEFTLTIVNQFNSDKSITIGD